MSLFPIAWSHLEGSVSAQRGSMVDGQWLEAWRLTSHLSMMESINIIKFSTHTYYFIQIYDLFALRRSGAGTGTGTRTDTIENNRSWSLFLSRISVNISVRYFTFHLFPEPVPLPFPCSVNIPLNSVLYHVKIIFSSDITSNVYYWPQKNSNAVLLTPWFSGQ